MDMAKGQGAPATAEAHGVPLGRTHSATEPRRQTSQARPGSGHRVAAAADRLSGCGLSCRRCCRCRLVRPQPGETYVRVSPESGCPSDLAKHLGYLFPTCFYFLLFGPFYYLRQGLMSAKLASNILCSAGCPWTPLCHHSEQGTSFLHCTLACCCSSVPEAHPSVGTCSPNVAPNFAHF